MIITIDTDKKELIIEKATVQEIYEYIARFGLLDYTIVPKQNLSRYPVYPTIPTYPTTDPVYKPPVYKPYDYKVTCATADIDNYFKAYYNII